MRFKTNIYPVVNKENEQYLVSNDVHPNVDVVPDFVIYKDNDIQTNFIKPGIVPNLLELCKPENWTWSISEEPDPQICIGRVLVEISTKNGDKVLGYYNSPKGIKLQIPGGKEQDYHINGLVELNNPLNNLPGMTFIEETRFHKKTTLVYKVNYSRDDKRLTISSVAEENMKLLGLEILPQVINYNRAYYKEI